MKYRNIQVAKMTGVKILAGLLVFGLTFSAPATAWAAESGLTEVTSNGSENGEKLQAKSIDGRDTLTEVSDLVLEMIHNEEIRYNEETGYLEDTGLRDAAKTGWKVDPITGDEGFKFFLKITQLIGSMKKMRCVNIENRFLKGRKLAFQIGNI